MYGLLAGNTLIRFDSANPSAVTTIGPVTGLGANQTLVGIDFRPRTGQLIGSTVATGSANNSIVTTYSINTTTGAATLIGATAAPIPGAGAVPTAYDFNPTVDRIRFANTNDENARLNPVNGSLAGDDTNLTPITVDIIEAAYDRNFDRQNGTTIPTTLFLIDRNGGQLSIMGGINGVPSPNGGVVTPIGSLGVTLNATAGAGFDIAIDPTVSAALNNNGLGRALASLTASDGITRLYDVNLATGAATLIGTIGTGASPLIGMTMVPGSAVVVGSGQGANGDVRILDADTGEIRQAVIPFAGFQGGVRVGAGDITGDGVADAIASAIAPQGHVKVFNGATGAEVQSFFAFAGFNGTVNVASGDVNGDGFEDILVVANGVNGHVKAFSGKDGSLLASFLAYPGFTGNVTVGAADFNNDGVAEIITSAALNGHTKVFNADGSAFVGPSGFSSSFFAFDGFVGDVFSAGGDVNGDGFADIIVVSGSPTAGNVRVFSGANGAQIANFITNVAFGTAPPVQRGSIAAVGVGDVNADGRLEILLSPGLGLPANVSAFDITGAQVGNTLTAFTNFLGGVTVSGSPG